MKTRINIPFLFFLAALAYGAAQALPEVELFPHVVRTSRDLNHLFESPGARRILGEHVVDRAIESTFSEREKRELARLKEPNLSAGERREILRQYHDRLWTVIEEKKLITYRQGQNREISLEGDLIEALRGEETSGAKSALRSLEHGAQLRAQAQRLHQKALQFDPHHGEAIEYLIRNHAENAGTLSKHFLETMTRLYDTAQEARSRGVESPDAKGETHRAERITSPEGVKALDEVTELIADSRASEAERRVDVEKYRGMLGAPGAEKLLIGMRDLAAGYRKTIRDWLIAKAIDLGIPLEKKGVLVLESNAALKTKLEKAMGAKELEEFLSETERLAGENFAYQLDQLIIEPGKQKPRTMLHPEEARKLVEECLRARCETERFVIAKISNRMAPVPHTPPESRPGRRMRGPCCLNFERRSH